MTGGIRNPYDPIACHSFLRAEGLEIVSPPPPPLRLPRVVDILTLSYTSCLKVYVYLM